MPQKGKALSIEQKLAIVTLKKSFDLERQASPIISTKDAVGRIARCLDVGRRTVERILSAYNKNGQTLVAVSVKARDKPPLKVSGDLVPHIRHHVRSMNLQGQHLSVRNVRSWLRQQFDIDLPVMTLWRTLQRVGFVYGKSQRRSTLKEQDYVIAARRRYLREKRSNRRADGTLKRTEVYLDETYLNKNHSNNNTWYLGDEGGWVNNPSGKGSRLIILHAITQEGWVEGAKLVFQAKTCSGDYHGQMDYNNFSKWFMDQLLPNIPPQSLIIMDNAKYHNVLADDTFPTPRSYKQELQAWLKTHHPHLHLHNDPSMLKPELYEVCKKLAPPPSFKLDRLAQQQGHKILRTPQYHCELQPIESCWGVVKNYCRDHCEFTMESLREHLHMGFSKVTPSTCKKLIAKVRQQEEAFWIEDAVVDNQEIIEEERLDSDEKYIDVEEHVFG